MRNDGARTVDASCGTERPFAEYPPHLPVGLTQDEESPCPTNTRSVSDAGCWLEGKAEERRELFSRLEKAVAEARTQKAGHLLILANATASHNRTKAETGIADSTARRARQQDIRERSEADRVRTLLATLERRGVAQSRKTMRHLVKELVRAAAGTGAHVDAQQHQQISAWKMRADTPPALAKRQTPAPAAVEPTTAEAEAATARTGRPRLLAQEALPGLPRRPGQALPQRRRTRKREPSADPLRRAAPADPRHTQGQGRTESAAPELTLAALAYRPGRQWMSTVPHAMPRPAGPARRWTGAHTSLG